MYFAIWNDRPLSSPLCLLQENNTSSVMAAISNSNTRFALELLRTLSQANPSGNIFVSPLSISSALAMVYLGAKGDTAAQMAQVSARSLYHTRLLHHLTPPSSEVQAIGTD